MARFVRTRSRRSFQGVRTPTRWENLIFEFVQTAAASQNILDLTPEPMATDLQGTATIKRMIGKLQVVSLSDAGSAQETLIGIAVITNDAFAAGAVPDPLTDAQQSWYYWNHIIVVPVGGAPHVTVVDFDMRTMRKLRGGYKLVAVVQNGTNVIALTVFATFRNLWVVD